MNKIDLDLYTYLVNYEPNEIYFVSGNTYEYTSSDYLSEVNELVKNGYKSNDAIKIVAHKYGIKKDDVYRLFHRIGDNK